MLRRWQEAAPHDVGTAAAQGAHRGGTGSSALGAARCSHLTRLENRSLQLFFDTLGAELDDGQADPGSVEEFSSRQSCWKVK